MTASFHVQYTIGTMARKKMTIEDLAIMVGKGFKGVDRRFDAVDRRIDALTDIVAKLARAMDDNFKHVYARLDRIRDDISDLPLMRTELRDLRERVSRLERKG